MPWYMPETEETFEIKRMIAYEQGDGRSKWRADLKFKTDFPYSPNPQSLHSLYSSAQIQAMPKFI